ncbi:hypothetical protein CAL29_24650 [Bordetella genomosp. 10]|uniref:Major facilitator superfamily (MFS) profile domain-containing protein n=1 Tax=Bordetella genomosp. 10 TaxID=1416804 RepID=A0A261S1C1_9BORD|nr:MFS transporter [Bordetella genomosp. 10]OZI31126.1 hypothetical protein CAL29_24650 [Bordetella genomosp. 10]
MTSALGYAERNASYWKKNLAVCVFGSFTTLVSLSMLLPFLPLYVQQLGAKSADDVVKWSAIAFDRIGSRKVIVGCLVATSLVLLPQAFVKAWWQLALLRGVMGATLAGLLPSVAKLIRQSVNEGHSGSALGYLQSAQFSGQVAGPLLGGAIGIHMGLPHVFFVTSALLLACAAMNHWSERRHLLRSR